MSPKGQTVMEVALRNAGMWKGWKACLYLSQWGIAWDELQKPLTASQVAEWWSESRATSYRNEACFKAAFPEEQSPERLWRLALANVPASDLAAVVPAVAATRWAA